MDDRWMDSLIRSNDHSVSRDLFHRSHTIIKECRYRIGEDSIPSSLPINQGKIYVERFEEDPEVLVFDENVIFPNKYYSQVLYHLNVMKYQGPPLRQYTHDGGRDLGNIPSFNICDMQDELNKNWPELALLLTHTNSIIRSFGEYLVSQELSSS